MANELTLSASLGYSKNNTVVQIAISNLLASVAGNGLENLSAYTAVTSNTVIPVGSITSPGGWFFVINTDATNYVDIYTGTAGTAFARMLPGEFAFFRFVPGVTAPSAQAHTASCVLKYAMFDL